MSGELNFTSSIENKQFIDGLRQMQSAVEQTTASVESGGNDMEKTFSRLKAAAAGALAGFSVKEFVSKVVSVRGEMQQLQVAFETMLGSADKASALMAQMVRTAATTPFGLQDVAQGATQLLAYGTEAEKVNETLIKLSDIAAGLSQPLNDLVYLYGTTMVQGRLYTQDLNQFTGRGIPMIQELAKQFGVAEGKVKELVEAGKVGFPEVEKVINSLTGEGGKFGGLMEAQSKTITGQIANIEDAIDMMFNEIGQKSEGVINEALDSVTYMVEHYEQFGRIIAGVAATWGTYKAAVMAVTAVQALQAAATNGQTVATVLMTNAQKALNATMLANPYVLVATAIVGLVAALASMKTETERVQDALNDYDAARQEAIASEEEHRKKIEELTAIAGDESLATGVRKDALVKLEMQYPSIFKKYDTEYEKLKHIRDIKAEIAALDGKTSVTNARNELKNVNSRIAELERTKAAAQWTANANSSSKNFGGLSQKEQAELKALQIKRTELTKSISKEQTENYFANLTGISNKNLETQIRTRKNLLAKMTVDQKAYGRIVGGDGAQRGLFKRNEIEGQLQLLQSERNRRGAARKTNAERGSGYKTAYEKALKEFNDFKSDRKTKRTDEEYDKEFKRLESNLKTAKENYENSKATTNKDNEKAERANAKREAAEEKRKAAEEKMGQELVNLQRENDAALIDAMDEGTAKKMAQIENDYQKRKNEISKQEADWQKENKKAGNTTGSNGLTTEQTEAVNTARANADKQYTAEKERLTRETFAAEQDALVQYLKQYGTFNEQKLAIEKEYAQKIDEVRRSSNTDEQKKWEIKSLENQKQSALAQVDQSAIDAQINWQAVFGTMTGMLRDQLEGTLRGLEKYINTDAFKKRSGEDQTKIYDAIDRLRDTLGDSKGTLNFGDLQKKMDAAGVAINKMQLAAKMSNSAFDQLQEAQDEYEKALLTGDEKVIQAAKDEVDQKKAAYEAVKGISEQTAIDAQNASRESSQSIADTVAGIEGTAGALQQMTSKSLAQSFEGFKNLVSSLDKLDIGGAVGDAISKLSDGLSNAGCIGQIISAILKLLDVFKEEGLGGLIADIIDSILGAVAGIIDNILSGDFIAQIVGSIVSGIGEIWDAVIGNLSGGLLSTDSIFGSHGNTKQIREAIDRLTKENEALEYSIDKLRESMDNSYGSKSISAYKEAREDLVKATENAQEILSKAQAYTGAHSSNAYYWNMPKEMTARVNELLGTSLSKNDWYEWAELTPEQMEEIKTHLPDVWSMMLKQGKYDKSEYFEDYIEYAGQLEELEDEMRENLLNTDWEGLRDSFIDTLMDMDSDAEDFADDFGEMMQRALLQATISDKLDKELEEWYNDLTNDMMDLTTGEYKELTDDQISEYKRRYDEMANRALEERDRITQITGYTGESNQEATSGGWESMGQDTADELNGRFTALQIAGENIASSMLSTLASLESLTSVQISTNGMMSEIRDAMINTNSYLEDVAKYAKNIYNEFGVKMDNTLKRLKEM